MHKAKWPGEADGEDRPGVIYEDDASLSSTVTAYMVRRIGLWLAVDVYLIANRNARKEVHLEHTIGARDVR